MACAGLLACCACIAGASQAAAEKQDTTEAAKRAAIAWLGKQVVSYQRTTWHWQRVMGVPRTRPTHRVLARMSVPEAKKAVARWKARARHAQKQAQQPPHLQALLCIHRYEGSWQDSGSPYYGGLQMNIGFQAAYGGHLLRTKGTADHWTPLEQMWVAEKALKSRGFYPWPNTARYCGLI
jgi:hypothetical protein